MAWIRESSSGVLISLLIQPRASKNEISGIQDDSLKVRLTAPPVGGAANKMCVSCLAKWLNVTKSSIDIISGKSSRRKQVLVRSHSNINKIKEKLEKAAK